MHADDRHATVAEFRDRLFADGAPRPQDKPPQANAVWIALALVAALAGLIVSLR